MMVTLTSKKQPAFYQAVVNDDTMSPRIMKGEVVYYDMNRSDSGNGFVVIGLKSMVLKTACIIRQLISANDKELVLCELKTAKQIKVARSQVSFMHPISFIGKAV